MDRIFIEENNVYQIDFTNALWATDKLNNIISDSNTILSDVDFIAETDDKILLVEYKNSNIKGAVNPTAFKPLEDKSINKIVRKFYDSLIYVNSVREYKPKVYIYIIETTRDDGLLRLTLRDKIKAKLPFKLQEQNSFKNKLIDDFMVLSIDEWNKKYPFPLTKI